MRKLIKIISDYKHRVFNSYWWKDFYYGIRNWFFPRQTWLIKKIPNNWIDKDTLFELCILEGIKHFVEKEKALDYFESAQNDPTYPEHQKVFDREVKENYHLITKVLPDLQIKLDKEFERLPKWNINNINKPFKAYKKLYGKIDKLEKEIEELQTQVMIWAVARRKCIWT